MKTPNLFLPTLLFLCGCATASQPIAPDSLNLFRDTLVDLNSQSVEALNAEQEWNYRNYKEQIKAENTTDPRPITLRFCAGDFDWQWGECGSTTPNPPVFKVIAQSKDNLEGINQALIDYANFLILFNNANLETESSVQDAIEQIGLSASSIATSLGTSIDQEKFGAFSTIGVSVAQQLLARKQREGMAAVMADFHPGVLEFARLGSEAMRISANGIKEEYNDENPKFTRSIATETDGTQRLAQVEGLFELNEKSSAQLDLLKTISGAYEALPQAHAELMSSLRSGRTASLGELISLIELISSATQSVET